ncbi:ABC transporter permease [Rhodovibrio salinarum]|uniref:Autoinducer 2 import system permease protein LsrD n=1 Tax=Rhodovibrio salinarum TaxID=1087 RepID=A0A934QHY9_9PROT|nr:ABC transporter permease [Rhodovibrio salinarum]MBK1697381.1 ABC transporter permease [Rhodovibrio salinarum]
MTTQTDNTMASVRSGVLGMTPARRERLRLFVKRNRIELSITGIFVVLYAIFIVGAPGVYTNFDIYRSFMSTLPFMGVMALAATFVITLGEIDLSFPSVMGMAAWGFGSTFVATGSYPLAVLVALATGGACGLLNGVMVAIVGVPSIVATIGTMFFWRGFVNVLAEGKGIPLSTLSESWMHPIFVGRIVGDIPMQFVWFLAIAVIMMMVYRRHVFGSQVLFVGDNQNSAHMMGIKVARVKILCFTLLGVMAGLGGVLLLSEVTYFWPTTGDGYLLPALAAVFIGGTPVFGGRGSMYGTFIGVLIIGSLEAGVVAMGIQGFYTQVIYGLLITIAVTIYAVIMRRN